MKTPFTTEQFLGIFEKYNTNVFPMQILLIAGGLLSLYLLSFNKKPGSLFTGIFLGLIWIWTGLVYQILFFREINKAAFVFGLVFILQGCFFLYEGLKSRRIDTGVDKSLRAYTGYLLMLTGLVIYPLVSLVLKGNVETTITPGLPCPTTIFTFGALLASKKMVPGYLLVVPALWSLVGISAAINFGIYQDFIMPLAAVTAIVWLMNTKRTEVQMA